eukprot:gene7616-6870_t
MSFCFARAETAAEESRVLTCLRALWVLVGMVYFAGWIWGSFLAWTAPPGSGCADRVVPGTTPMG